MIVGLLSVAKLTSEQASAKPLFGLRDNKIGERTVVLSTSVVEKKRGTKLGWQQRNVYICRVERKTIGQKIEK